MRWSAVSFDPSGIRSEDRSDVTSGEDTADDSGDDRTAMEQWRDRQDADSSGQRGGSGGGSDTDSSGDTTTDSGGSSDPLGVVDGGNDGVNAGSPTTGSTDDSPDGVVDGGDDGVQAGSPTPSGTDTDPDSGGGSAADSGGDFEFGTGAGGESFGGEDSTIGSETDTTNEEIGRGAGGRVEVQSTESERQGGPDREFDPDATQTGAAETRDDQLGEQARQLENELTGQQISELSQGLNQSGAELRSEDVLVEVTGEGQNRRLEAQLSPVGQERVDFLAEGQRQQSAEVAVEQELNRPFASSDVTVADGDVQVSNEVQREANRQARGGPAQTDVSPDTGRFVETEAAVTSETDRFESQVDRVENLTGRDVPGEGDILPGRIDVSAGVEDATGRDLPESAGGAVANRFGINAPSEADLIGDGITAARRGFNSARDTAAEIDRRGSAASVEARARLLEGVIGDDAPSRQEIREMDDRTRDFGPTEGIALVAGPIGAAGRGAQVGFSAAQAARATAGIGGIAGGAAVVNEVGIPERGERDRTELDAPTEQQQAEIDTPDPRQQQNAELQPGEQFTRDEVQVPDQQQQTDPGVLRTQQVLGGQLGQQEQQQEQPPDRREITEEDIVTDIGEPEQNRPSVREQQRREGLTPPERNIATGESAVADGTGTAEAQERVEQAQQREATRAEPTETAAQNAGTRPVGLFDTAQSPLSGVIPALDQGTDTAQGQQFRQQPRTRVVNEVAQQATPTEVRNPNLTENRFQRPNANARSRSRSRSISRLDPPEFDGGDSDDEEETPPPGGVQEVVSLFRDPLTGEVLEDT